MTEPITPTGKRLVVELPGELHAEFKAACAEGKTTQARLVRDWVETYVSTRRRAGATIVAPSASRGVGLSKKAQAQGRSRK